MGFAETNIQNAIRVALSPHALLFRTNAGKAWQGRIVFSKEFNQKILINLTPIELLPEGYSDLSGLRKSDGKALFIECKTAKGIVKPEQEHFVETMQSYHALAGVARSVNDALQIAEVGI